MVSIGSWLYNWVGATPISIRLNVRGMSFLFNLMMFVIWIIITIDTWSIIPTTAICNSCSSILCALVTILYYDLAFNISPSEWSMYT